MTGLYKDRGQAVWKLQNFFRQKEDSFQLLWLLLQLDSTYRTTPSKVLFMMEELYEKGCASPLLYIEAWKMISEDVSLLHRLTPFWMQVFCYAGKHDLLTEELVMRMAYLSGYEKNSMEVCIRRLQPDMRNFHQMMCWRLSANIS